MVTKGRYTAKKGQRSTRRRIIKPSGGGGGGSGDGGGGGGGEGEGHATDGTGSIMLFTNLPKRR